ncbi:hypothetical protein Scep_025611 [Stephania cephalantha]|uniref:Uncharacterized protein n=1 Tax=Stephania cephalantha TaxID=152367 RepID=A0AAP0ENT2_9MAGN
MCLINLVRFIFFAELLLLVHWSVHFFAIFYFKLLQNLFGVFLLTNKDFLFALFNFHSKKECH